MGLRELKNQRHDQSLASVDTPKTPTVTNDIVMFRGTQSGLEIQIDSDAAFENILLELLDKVETSGSFFSDAKTTVRFSKKPIPGILANLETIADKYNLTIVSIRSTGDEQKTSMSWIKRINAISQKRLRERKLSSVQPPKPERVALPPLRAKSPKRASSFRQRVA